MAPAVVTAIVKSTITALEERTHLLGKSRRYAPKTYTSSSGSSTLGEYDIPYIADGSESAFTSSGEGGRSHRGLTLCQATYLIVAQVSGLGILTLPYAMAQTGWSGVAVLCLSCVGVIVSATQLGRCWVILEERWCEYRMVCRRPYPTIALRTFGKAGWYLVAVTQNLVLFGITIVLILLSAELVNSVLHTVLPQLTICSWIVITGAAFVPLSWFSSPKEFWTISIVAIIATVVACVVVIAEILEESTDLPTPEYPLPTFSSFFLGFGTILFSFGGALTFPTIQNDMANRSEFSLSVIIAFLAILTMYMPLSCIGYLMLGRSVDINVLLDVSGPAVTIAKLLMLVNNIFTYTVAVNPLGQSFEEILSLPNEFGWKRCVLRTALVVFGTLVGLAVIEFGKIVNLIGALSVPLTTFILPPLFYMRLCDMPSHPAWPIRTIGAPERALLWAVVVLGTLGGAAGTWAGLGALLAPGTRFRSCFFSSAGVAAMAFNETQIV